jgi:[protein-PII] uridylyltransferase
VRHGREVTPASSGGGRDPSARFLAARAAVIAAEELTAAQRRRALSDLCDAWLTQLLGEVSGVALVAVGGYGRRELLPGSDLDIVLLHHDGVDATGIADRIFYTVWDTKIPLDHAVRTPAEAREISVGNLKAALGLLDVRHVAGDLVLTEGLRVQILADWRQQARRRLPELATMCRDRAARIGELAYLLEPDLVDAYGGLRDILALRAVSMSWLAERRNTRGLDEAREWLLTVRDTLHRTTGRRHDRLVLPEQDSVAERLNLRDADALVRRVSEAGRVVAYAADITWRDVARTTRRRGRGGALRQPLADGVVVQDGEAVLAMGARPDHDPVLALRAGAAAAQAGLPLAPATVARIAAEAPPLPVPWPAQARDALISLLGAGSPAVNVWEALDAVGLVTRWIPAWEHIRFRPQRTPVHRHTVDRHSLQAAVEAAALTRLVARPDLLLVAALLHDLGKGLPGDHSEVGALVARDTAIRMGFAPTDVDVIATLVRHHLLLPEAATRRDLDDPTTIASVAEAAGSREVLDLLAALTQADATAAGPLAWTPWRARLVAELVSRVQAVLGGATVPEPAGLDEWQLALAAEGRLAVRLSPEATIVTVVAPDRPGLLAAVTGVLTLHRLAVRTAMIRTEGDMSVQVLQVEPSYSGTPLAEILREDIRRTLEGSLDIDRRLAERAANWQPPAVPVPEPSVRVLADASADATVIEVRAHDVPGLLHTLADALTSAGVSVRSAVVGTLGAEAVDVFYLVHPDGGPLDPGTTEMAVKVLRTALGAAVE